MKKTIIIWCSIITAVIITLAFAQQNIPSKPHKEVSQEEAILFLEKNPNDKIDGYYLDDAGNLCNEDIGIITPVHTINIPIAKESRALSSDKNSKVYWNMCNSTISKYQFGESQSYTVDDDFIYCGRSNDMIGYVFRRGDEVLALDTNLTAITKITDNVEFVLDCEYKFDNDFDKQPLFLMKDGSIMAYLQGKGLCELTYEGGASGTRIK